MSKYYEIYLEEMEEEFEGVIECNDEKEALEKIDNGEYIKNFKFALRQRGFVLKEVDLLGYENSKRYAESR